MDVTAYEPRRTWSPLEIAVIADTATSAQQCDWKHLTAPEQGMRSLLVERDDILRKRCVEHEAVVKARVAVVTAPCQGDDRKASSAIHVCKHVTHANLIGARHRRRWVALFIGRTLVIGRRYHLLTSFSVWAPRTPIYFPHVLPAKEGEKKEKDEVEKNFLC